VDVDRTRRSSVALVAWSSETAGATLGMHQQL
jgi:hypothetical protein